MCGSKPVQPQPSFNDLRDVMLRFESSIEDVVSITEIMIQETDPGLRLDRSIHLNRHDCGGSIAQITVPSSRLPDFINVALQTTLPRRVSATQAKAPRTAWR
jgi:hypothetical protein